MSIYTAATRFQSLSGQLGEGALPQDPHCPVRRDSYTYNSPRARDTVVHIGARVSPVVAAEERQPVIGEQPM